MKLTLPQIIMLNHGAHVNDLRSDERIAAKKEQESEGDADPVVWHGKRVSELDSEQFMSYFMSKGE